MNLRAYQNEAVECLFSKGSAGLFYDTGTGKTAILCGLIDRANCKKSLYICPATLKFTVKEEIEKWLPGKKIIVIDGTPLQRALLWLKIADVYICSYEILLRDLKYPSAIEWDLIACDEAQKIQNPRGKITKCVKSLQSPRRIAMTATPIMSKPENIWSLIDWIKPNHLSNFWAFRATYCVLNHFNQICGYRNLPELNARIKDLYIMKHKREVVAELPPITTTDIVVHLSPEERRIYDSVKKELLFELKDKDLTVSLASLGSAITNMLRLKQICNSLELVGDHRHSAKIATLKELLEEQDGKVLIFSEFAEMAKIVHRELEDKKPFLLIGETSAQDRAQIVSEFSKSPDRNICILSNAGGAGLNLQAANVIINIDLPWSLGVYKQRIGRIERIGQDKNMLVYNLLAHGTIDRMIRKRLDKKEEMTNEVLGVEDNYSTIRVAEVISALEEE